MALYTLPGYALVKLSATGKYKNIAATQKVYEAASSGTLLKFVPAGDAFYEFVPAGDAFYEIALGKTVYWEELNAKPPIDYQGGLFCYVKLTDLMGFEEPI
jgi:hypothetical protein